MDQIIKNADKRNAYVEMPLEKKNDRNAKKRKNRAEMPPEKINDLKLKRKERAESRKRLLASNPNVSDTNMGSPQENLNFHNIIEVTNMDVVSLQEYSISDNTSESLAIRRKEAGNAKRRKTYSEMSMEKKDEVLFRKRQNSTAPITSRRTKNNVGLLENVPSCARNLPIVADCKHCKAKRFKGESDLFCCGGGEIYLEPIQIPENLRLLIVGTTPQCIHFKNNIRTYNNNLSFTTFGGKYDTDLTANRDGIYNFKIQGQTHHYLKPLKREKGDTVTKYPRSGVQLYFYDTDQDELKKRMETWDRFDDETMKMLMGILKDNPYRRFFRQLRRMMPDLVTKRIVLNSDPNLDQRSYNLPSVSQVAAIYGDNGKEDGDRTVPVQLYGVNGETYTMKHFFGCYDPMQYPLMFPGGQPRWHRNVKRIEKRRFVRSDDGQKILTFDSPQSLIDAESKCNGYLPASFIGGPRDMRQRYLDAMTIVQKFGKPDVFLTMTCNPSWKEIETNLKYGETANDRPDLCARVFKAKVEELKEDLVTKEVLGALDSLIYAIEYQKRGLPHVHMLIILKPGSKPLGPDGYDRIVCVELPDPDKNPHLFEVVKKNMMHGPCGKFNSNSPCMVKTRKCKFDFPKPFRQSTCHAEDGYPLYRRRNDGRTIRIRKVEMGNNWVVGYNRYLSATYGCHINLEICSTITLVKYIHKYIFITKDLTSYQEFKLKMKINWRSKIT